MASVKDLNELKTILSQTDNSTHVVLYVTADWCIVCKRITPYIKQNVDSKSNMLFVMADYDVAKTIVHKYKIQVVPCFIRFLNNEIESVCMSGSEKNISDFFSEF